MSMEDFQRRREGLIDLLDRDKSLLAKTFVHLCAYFDSSLGGVGLADLENELLRRRIEPFMLQRRKTDFTELTSVLKSHLEDRETFEVIAASFLKEADHRLSLQSQSIISGQYDTFDSQRCYVRKRNNYLAALRAYDSSSIDETETRPVGTRGQGLSLFPYTKKCACVVVPTSTAALQLRFASLSWDVTVILEQIATSSLQENEYRVLLWAPPDTEFRHADLLSPSNEPYVSLNEPLNLTEVESALMRGLEFARKHRATVLIFPELSVPPSVESLLRESLREKPDEPPFITVYGRIHRPAKVSDEKFPLDLNQAVVLGPAGQELCVHDKLTTFGEIPATKHFKFFDRPWPHGISERNQKGKSLTVLDTPIGVLCPLICKDLLDERIEHFILETHIDTILLPSLSPQTSAHYDVARRLLLRSWASVFVANRCLEPIWIKEQTAWRLPAEKMPDYQALFRIGASFYSVPRNNRSNQCVCCGRETPDIPFLLFKADSDY